MKIRRRNKRCIVCNNLTKRGGLHCCRTCWGITNAEKLKKNAKRYYKKKNNKKIDKIIDKTIRGEI